MIQPKTLTEQRQKIEEQIDDVLKQLMALKIYEKEKQVLIREYYMLQMRLDQIEFTFEKRYEKGINRAEKDGFNKGEFETLKKIAERGTKQGLDNEMIADLLGIETEQVIDMLAS